MEIKLVKPSPRSQKYRLDIPVEYFESMGYNENDVVDVDIVINPTHKENIPTESIDEYIKFEPGVDAECNDGVIPYGQIIPIENVLYVGKKLYYFINGKIVEYNGKRFEIDIKTGKIKNPTSDNSLSEVKPRNSSNYARFV